MKNLTTLSVVSSLFLFTFATRFASAADASAAGNLAVQYTSEDWNNSSEKIDTSYMFVRDKTTGKIAKILLEETAPDSSQFEGHFSIQFGETGLDPEFFVPPANVSRTGDMTQFNRLLSEGKLKPHEMATKTDGGKTTYQVFDTKSEADQARKNNEREQAAKKSNLIKPKADEASLAVAAAAAKQALMAKLAKEAAAKEAARLNLQQIEEQKRAKLKKEMESLAAAEQQRRKVEAAKYAEIATADYSRGDFASAEKNFRKATELDPENRNYYFKFGVTLYRVEKLDEALVILKLAKVDAKTELEKTYYMGLIYYKQKALAQAKDAFGKVKAADDKALSPSAAFYLGLVLMAEDKLPESQAQFEYVVDKSSDPALDKKAEEYIEQIANMMAYKKLAAKKWMITASGSLMYDSDILLTPTNGDAATGAASKKGGGRTAETLAVERRLFFFDTSEMSVKFNGAYTESFSSAFVSGDPTDASLTLPYARKGTWGGKGYKLTLTPGYESLFMDYSDTGVATYSRPDILNSYTGEADLLVVMKDDWFMQTTLDVRKDNSLLPDGGADDASAIKYAIRETETVFLDTAKKTALVGFIGYTLNQANGDNVKFNRIDFGVVYSTPIEKFKNLAWNVALTGYHQTYPNKANDTGGTGEKDDDASFALGLTKIVNERWSWLATAAYTDNSSNENSAKYDKYLVMGTITYNWDDAPRDKAE